MAANREERYARVADPPAWLSQNPGVFAGRDRSAGGTWQGITPSGLVVAVTNRSHGLPQDGRRSRGQLCLDALRQGTAAGAADWLATHLSGQPYNPCNLLCADAEEAFALHHNALTTDTVSLEPGIHLLADTDVDDAEHPRLRRARQLLAGPQQNPWPRLRTALALVMADHGPRTNADGAICRHGELGGTVSSAILALTGKRLSGAEFWYAGGAPCSTPYTDLSARLHPR
jgi:uncharacterized protein with NRDE domain